MAHGAAVLPGRVDRTVGFSETSKIAAADFSALRAAVVLPYTEHGIVLRRPDPILDQTVLFNQYLLDLSYNGKTIVCELFRWADIWSRGLGPGALLTSRIDPARRCLDVDLARHEKATARALKTTGDALQGGSAEGVSHLTNAPWEYYLVTGDRAYLARATEGIRPWVEAWLARDYAHVRLPSQAGLLCQGFLRMAMLVRTPPRGAPILYAAGARPGDRRDLRA